MIDDGAGPDPAGPQIEGDGLRDLAHVIQGAGWDHAALELWRTLRERAPYREEADFESRVAQDLALFERCRKVIIDDS